MKLKGVFYFVPLMGLIAYTIGAFFLLAAPSANLFLSPGEGSIVSGIGVIPFLTLVISGGMVIGMVILGRKKRK